MYNIERQRAFNAEVCKANFPPSLRTFVFNFFAGFPALVGLSGLEPPTSRLSGVRSNRLSYKPISWIRGGCPAPCTLILLDTLLSWWR